MLLGTHVDHCGVWEVCGGFCFHKVFQVFALCALSNEVWHLVRRSGCMSELVSEWERDRESVSVGV